MDVNINSVYDQGDADLYTRSSLIPQLFASSDSDHVPSGDGERNGSLSTMSISAPGIAAKEERRRIVEQLIYKILMAFSVCIAIGIIVALILVYASSPNDGSSNSNANSTVANGTRLFDTFNTVPSSTDDTTTSNSSIKQDYFL